MRSDTEQCAQTFRERRKDGALAIDFPIESHENLNGLHLPIMGREFCRLVNVLVGQVFDRMTENLQCMTTFQSDMAANTRS